MLLPNPGCKASPCSQTFHSWDTCYVHHCAPSLQASKVYLLASTVTLCALVGGRADPSIRPRAKGSISLSTYR